MIGVEAQDQRTAAHIQRLVGDVKAADATSQRLKESYIRLLVLANAGGIAACLGIAGSLAGHTAEGQAHLLSAVVGPLSCFLVGVITAGSIVVFMYKAALHETEQHARKLAAVLQAAGQFVATPKSVFTEIEKKGISAIDKAITICGAISPLVFLVGAIWGLVLIAHVH